MYTLGRVYVNKLLRNNSNDDVISKYNKLILVIRHAEASELRAAD